METVENIKIVAAFMGVTPTKSRSGKDWYDGSELAKAGLPFSCGIMGNGTYTPPFATSWDWLMPVVKKIVGVCTDNDTLFSSDHYTSKLDTIPCANIEDSYKVIVEFIKWYNNQ